MKYLLALSLLALTLNASADSNMFCAAAVGSETQIKCAKVAPLANKDVIRSITLVRDEFLQNYALDSVLANPTVITSNMIQDCYWSAAVENTFNAAVADKCIKDLKDQKGDLP